MPYGLKYINEFNSQSSEGETQKTYFLQFLFKDYTGPEIRVEGGETSVIQRCTLDDPIAPIKGQSLDITLINENNSLPITAFQSEDDDGVQVRLYDGINLLFIGFLVQDDFYESLVDHTHTIALSANDSLGLLKGVILSEAEVRRSFTVTYRTQGSSNNLVYIKTSDPAFYPTFGGVLTLQGVDYNIISFQNVVTTISGIDYNWIINVSPDTPGFGATTELIYLTGEVDLLQRNSILSMIAVCLAQTNLALITNIFHNLYEYMQDNAISTFDQTLIDSQLFISGDTYDNCYDSLSKLLTAFKCSLFQANGQWNIVHWFEAKRYANNAIPGFVYDESWTSIGTTILNNNFFIGPTQLTTWTAGLQAGAMRGLKFSRKVFDYTTPKYLWVNYDLQNLGPLIRTYQSGLYQISEYTAIGFLGIYGTPAVERFIRVEVLISTNTESARYFVLRGPTFDSARAVPSTDIDAQEGDRISVQLEFKTNISQTGSGGFSFAFRLTNGTTTYYMNEDGSWISTIGWSYVLPSGENTNTWHSIDTGESDPMPISGKLTIFFRQITFTPQNSSRESHYKNLRLEYIPYTNETTKIIGHIHKQERITGPKLNEDVEIQIDDSPRNSIAGTLFNPTFTGLLQDRTRLWRYPATVDTYRLGESATLDELTHRQQTRTKLEGGFIGNYQNSVISLLSMCIMDFDTTKNYTFGLLTIDYKRNRFSGSLWELWQQGQPELNNTYTFEYKYSTE